MALSDRRPWRNSTRSWHRSNWKLPTIHIRLWLTAQLMTRMNINLAALNEVKCRFCDDHPVGIFHVPDVDSDRVLALCPRHIADFLNNGAITCLIDLRLRQKKRG